MRLKLLQLELVSLVVDARETWIACTSDRSLAMYRYSSWWFHSMTRAGAAADAESTEIMLSLWRRMIRIEREMTACRNLCRAFPEGVPP